MLLVHRVEQLSGVLGRLRRPKEEASAGSQRKMKQVEAPTLRVAIQVDQ
jgi:hypothetical protein